MCVLIRHTFCESLVKVCVTKHKCHSFLLFFRHRALLPAWFSALYTLKWEHPKRSSDRKDLKLDIWYKKMYFGPTTPTPEGLLRVK